MPLKPTRSTTVRICLGSIHVACACRYGNQPRQFVKDGCEIVSICTASYQASIFSEEMPIFENAQIVSIDPEVRRQTIGSVSTAMLSETARASNCTCGAGAPVWFGALLPVLW